MPLVCHHDIAGLEVAMEYLLAVHISQGVGELRHKLPCEVFGQFPFLHKLLERSAVDIFHNDGGSHIGHRLHAYRVADVRMVELYANLKFLVEHQPVGRSHEKVGLETFQHVALAETPCRVDAGMA